MTPDVRISSEPIGPDDLARLGASSARPYAVSYVEHVPAGEAAPAFVCYSAFRELAEAAAREICNEILSDTPDHLEVFVCQRLGTLTSGDAALLVSVRADRFEAAYGACGRLAARLRARGPVWREVRP